MQMDILIATKNHGKFQEIHEMMKSFDARFLSMDELGISKDFDETGGTFEENALGKARFYSSLSGLPTLSDDSGIYVNALGDELGIETRRWGAGEKATDEEWLNFFMNRMKEETDRSAKFICAAAFSSPKIEIVEFGETEGVITNSIIAPVKKGIPLSSVFMPNNYDMVYAELSSDDKNKLSHRGKAFAKILKQLTEHYA